MSQLSDRQAYLAMFHFLEAAHDRGVRELGEILGAMALLPDGSPVDQAFVEDWAKSIAAAKRDEINAAFVVSAENAARPAKPLKDPHLRRFWFKLPVHAGVGVSAHSLEEAKTLAQAACELVGWDFTPTEVLEDVDIRELDQLHVVPNIGPPNLKGVWYPRMNI